MPSEEYIWREKIAREYREQKAAAARAPDLEAENKKLRERVRELEQLISDAYYYVPDSMNCAGYKCRLPQCSACYDQDEDSGVGDILARMQAVMEKGEE